MNKILNNEITDSLEEIVKKRLTSPIYGVFLISWIIFHWEFIFTMFFVSEEKIWQTVGLLKNDYLSRTFFDFSDWYFYISWILPFIITWLVIWKFPKWISIPAFKKGEEDKTEKRIIEIIEQRKLEEESVKKLKVVTEKAYEQKEIKKLDPTVGWREEYEQFKKSVFYHKFRFILASIYKHNGRISIIDPYSGKIEFEISKDILIYSHTNGLITIDKKSNEIDLTDKGKFFVKLFSLESPYLLQ